MKKETLTKEEAALIPVVRDEWINRLDKCPKLDRAACIEGILWLYKFSKLKEPIVMGVKSPLAAQFAAHILKANVRANVWDNVWANVAANVAANVWDNVWGKIEYLDFSAYGSMFDFGWVAFHDYFERIGLDLENENFGKFRSLLQSGIYDSIQLDGLCIVCEMPGEIHRDDKKRLHSISGPSIVWEDGYKLFHLWGVTFAQDLFEKIITRKISAKEIIKLENMEQRMAALKFIGTETFISELGAKVINKSRRGNELLEVKSIFPTTQYCLRYRCPSTGREYVSFVDPIVGKKKDADKAMAWKFGLESRQYDTLEIES